MKPLPNEIVLRPRFQWDVPEAKEEILQKFEMAEHPPFLVKRLDEHVFIKFNAQNNHFWSPQLHLQIEDIDATNSHLYGIFGPNPTLWTFFMFIHFTIACLFIIFGIWAYSSASLNKPYHIQMGIMGFLVILWFVLYFFGRSGKQKGKPQMQELQTFTRKILEQEA
ncbi:GTP-binding protein [Zobellia galactanivorans]|uniref:GTP-binding protein n=1 Tax=Zobellia galactanivorans (strain DSM 12802 / CCUG 47099 / CIP 106680 / NCIMB 13871 / Dsij) TaxID=63186 RepID=UPI0026E12208|nr:GTP-binding protein [Zobellia galactanivorans]MDO6807332.1 GTP-binding protein [Zobellia galactanivorans]